MLGDCKFVAWREYSLHFRVNMRVSNYPWPAGAFTFRGRAAGSCAALALVLAACEPAASPVGKATISGKGKAEVRPALPPKNVRVATVSRQPLERLLVVVGSLAPREQTTLSVKVPGRLQSITVDLGSSVEKDQVIAQIERQDYELKFKQAEALIAQARARLGLPLEGQNDRVLLENASAVKQARATLDEAMKHRDRVAKLTQQKILAASELETAEAAYQVALNKHQTAVEDVQQQQALLIQRRVELEIARQQLQDSAIVAPFAGLVQERRANAGEYLNVGAPLAMLVRTDTLRLRVEVPERDATSIRLGQSVRLTLEGGTNIHTGNIARLSPAISEHTRMLVVEADVKNNGTLRPGAFARAEILLEDKQPATVIPKEALVTFAGIEKVFLVVDGKAVEKNINTGRRTDRLIEVAKELKPGDVVVVNPGTLQGGQAVILESAATQGPAKKEGDNPKGQGGP